MFLDLFFFFKQKTAYEMRISDWSSDVCSSDLLERDRPGQDVRQPPVVVDPHHLVNLWAAEVAVDDEHALAGRDARQPQADGDRGLALMRYGRGDQDHPRHPALVPQRQQGAQPLKGVADLRQRLLRSEEHTSELQSLL